MDIAFVGDSITEGGAWDEWFPGLHTRNFGVGGDRVADVLDRLQAVRDANVVYLLIGTNDITHDMSDANILAGLRQVVITLRSQLPVARIVVQGVMPRSPELSERILNLNARYAEIAWSTGAQYLDLWPAFATDDGALDPEFTEDRLHLNARGYAAWVEVLRADLTAHAPPSST